jgi:hypothetical protein
MIALKTIVDEKIEDVSASDMYASAMVPKPVPPVP